MYVVGAFCTSELCNLRYEWRSAITWLGYVNSSINPLIYSFTNKEFKNAFKRVICFTSSSVINDYNGTLHTHEAGERGGGGGGVVSTTGGGVNCYKGDQLSSHYRSYATNDPFNVRYFSSSRAYNGIEFDAISSASCTGTFTGIPSTVNCYNNIDNKCEQQQMHHNTSSHTKAPVNSCLKPSVHVTGSVSREKNLNVVFDIPSSASSSVVGDISCINNCPITSGSYGNLSIESTSSSTGSLKTNANVAKNNHIDSSQGYLSVSTSSTHNNSTGVKVTCHTSSSIEMSPSESDSSTQVPSTSHLSTSITNKSTSVGSSSVTLSVLSSPLTSVRYTCVDQVNSSRKGHSSGDDGESQVECVDDTSDRSFNESNELISKTDALGQAVGSTFTKVTGSNKGVNSHRSSSRRFRVLARQNQCTTIETDSMTDSDVDASAAHRSNVSLLSSQWSLISMGDKCANRNNQSTVKQQQQQQQQQEQVNITADTSSITGETCHTVTPGDHSNGTSMDTVDKKTIHSSSECEPLVTHETPLLVTSSDSLNLVTPCATVDTEKGEE